MMMLKLMMSYQFKLLTENQSSKMKYHEEMRIQITNYKTGSFE